MAFLVDAPMTAKDISLPTILCLSILLEQNATKTPSVSTESKEDFIAGDFLDQPSTSGIILEQPSTNGVIMTGDFLDQPSSEHSLA